MGVPADGRQQRADLAGVVLAQLLQVRLREGRGRRRRRRRAAYSGARCGECVARLLRRRALTKLPDVSSAQSQPPAGEVKKTFLRLDPGKTDK
jgi:hypothetical protein